MAAPTVATMMKLFYSFVRTGPLISAKIIESMNRCIKELSEEYDLELLIDQDTVVTSTSLRYKALPADFHKNLFWAYNSDTDQEMEIYRSVTDLERDYFGHLDEDSDVVSVTENGTYLYYQGVPTSAAQNIVIKFYRQPTLLTTTSDTPDCFPQNIAEPLLVHYAVLEHTLKLKQSKENDQRLKIHLSLYEKALEGLKEAGSRETARMTPIFNRVDTAWRI